jgi:hypothetical protein
MQMNLNELTHEQLVQLAEGLFAIMVFNDDFMDLLEVVKANAHLAKPETRPKINLAIAYCDGVVEKTTMKLANEIMSKFKDN